MRTNELIFSHDSRRALLKKGAAVAGFLALGTGGSVAASGDGDEQNGGDSPTASIDFENQSTDGTTVEVATVDLSEGGYVAIHDASLLDGDVVESVIGVSEFLESGDQDSVEVTLFDVEGADFEDSNLEEDQPLIAMPHRETSGNETYDFVSSGGEEDGPYTRAGNAVVDIGFVTIE